MPEYFFFYGLVFGLVLAAPVGPVAALCFERTINEGRLHGLLSSLGAAFADAIFGGIAAFGISAISVWIEDHGAILRLVGGVVLLFLAVKTLTAPARAQTGKVAARIHTESLAQDFVSTFVLAITNPMTLIGFVGVFATIHVADESLSLWEGIWLVAGVFVGSALWWIALSAIADFIRDLIDEIFQQWVNRVSAGILFVFGLAVLLSLVL